MWCRLKILVRQATSALDAESEASVQEALDRLLALGRCTVVLVAHRLSTVVNAHNIAVIDKGVVKEQGTHATLLQQNGIYAKLVSRQLQRAANLIEADQVSAKLAAAAPAVATKGMNADQTSSLCRVFWI